MTPFEQFIFNYFISVTALAGFAVIWRNWLEDHLSWKEWLQNNLRVFAKVFTCGSCFTFWISLAFVLYFDPLKINYAVQWMSVGYGAVFLRFLYVSIQQCVSRMVHESHR